MLIRTKQNHALNQKTLQTDISGSFLLKNPFLNKDTAFTAKERQLFDLDGLLPPHIETIEDQVQRCYRAYSRKQDALEKHIYLRGLQDRNETLFYRLIIDHLKEMLPTIYTPTVGESCQHFSRIYRQPRGLFISYPHKHRIEEILDNAPIADVRVIVVTDGERILGLGDQGAGGMGIPIGKLSLYTACGYINPLNTLPIVLDVGTNNPHLRNDPSYIGWRHERITGDDYFDFVDLFVQAVKKKFPHVLLQFEDFAQNHANILLRKYRQQLCTFNDDIQGTAAVAVSALIAAVKSAGSDLQHQRIVVFGAGSAGCGISEQLVNAMQRHGLTEKQARSRFYMVDRQGLLHDGMTGLLDFQKAFLQPQEKVASWADDSGHISLIQTIKKAQPTILLGLSGVANQFTREVVESMAQHCAKPIIFPMSNPTSRCEALPEDIIAWTQGRALVATGSPFDPVEYAGHTYDIAQSNNCYIFPGLGLGILAAQATYVSDGMFMAATLALSEKAPALVEEGGALLPDLARIREISDHLALAVAKKAQQEGHAPQTSEAQLKANIEATKWSPAYCDMTLQR
jgi:malate dehydrogenase (oxaloacetate-decarboxylating)